MASRHLLSPSQKAAATSAALSQAKLDDAVKRIEIMEKLLVGGMGNGWITGLRDDVRDARHDISELRAAYKTSNRIFISLLGVAVSGTIGLLIDLLNNLNGWWGTAHAVLHGVIPGR